ncbi:MAG: reverse transcriptase/maturase family protein [bacterium]
MKIQLISKFEDIVILENLLDAWQEFVKGKRSRRDVQEFELNLMANIFSLHRDLLKHTYKHGPYQAFKISDPKPRNIHKASVRDRLLHRAVYRILYPFFDKTFIADSFSCRLDKGTHKAINRFRSLSYKVSQNHTKTIWVLKCDIRKFFASIDQGILMRIIKEYIPDQNIIWLISQIIYSFQSTANGQGLPLGNLTSQLLANVYLNRLDQFIKHQIKAKNYIRYADDFVVFSQDKKWLTEIIPQIGNYLENDLHLQLHPDKISVKTIASGVDYLGWVYFPDYRVLRTASKRKMFRNIKIKSGRNETVQSYLGLLSHGNTEKLKKKIACLNA